MHKGGRYIDARIQLSRENMISDYNSASSNSTSYLLEKLLFYIYYGHVNRTHAVGAMLIKLVLRRAGLDRTLSPRVTRPDRHFRYYLEA